MRFRRHANTEAELAYIANLFEDPRFGKMPEQPQGKVWLD